MKEHNTTVTAYHFLSLLVEQRQLQVWFIRVDQSATL